MKQLSDEQLRAKTDEFRQRIRERVDALEDPDEKDRELKLALDEILPQAFAVAREAGWRVLKMRHFDVQLVGGVVLHQGKIAEMKTGEGKTLVATLPVYLNALSGRGVHVITVNDYLAKRDSEWMGKLYTFLGEPAAGMQARHPDLRPDPRPSRPGNLPPRHRLLLRSSGDRRHRRAHAGGARPRRVPACHPSHRAAAADRWRADQEVPRARPGSPDDVPRPFLLRGHRDGSYDAAHGRI